MMRSDTMYARNPLEWISDFFLGPTYRVQPMTPERAAAIAKLNAEIEAVALPAEYFDEFLKPGRPT